MKKIVILSVALAFVMSLGATPINLKKQVTTPSERMEQQIQRSMNMSRDGQKKTYTQAIRKSGKKAATFTYLSENDSTTQVDSTGYKVVLAKSVGTSTPKWDSRAAQMLVYTNNTITISGGVFSRVELTFSKGNGQYAEVLTASKDSVISGGISTSDSDVKKDVWTGESNSVVFTIASSGKRALKKITIYGQKEVIVVGGLTMADAQYTNGGWSFELFAGLDGAGDKMYPMFHLESQEKTTNKKSILGNWTIGKGNLWTSATDSIAAVDGSLRVTANIDGTYNFMGYIIDMWGDQYKCEMYAVDVYAFDVDNDWDMIDLNEKAAPLNLSKVDAYYSEGYWNFDIYAGVDQAKNKLYPEVMFSCYAPAKRKNSIVGKWGLYEGQLWNSKTDSVGVLDGTLDVSINEDSTTYRFVGSVLSEFGNTLTFDIVKVNVAAYDADNDSAKIDLDEFGEAPIDTTDVDTSATLIKTFNTIELAQYMSYSEEGAYDYSLNIYNYDNIYPYLYLDIILPVEGAFEGTYSIAKGNVNAEYSGFALDEETDAGLKSIEFTIAKDGDKFSIVGAFVDSLDKAYKFNVSAEPYIYDGDFPYEPMEAQDKIELEFDMLEIDNQYVSEYGELDYYLYSPTDTMMLTFYTENTALEEVEEGEYQLTYEDSESFIQGYYMNYFGYDVFGGCYLMTAAAIYYLIEGTIAVAVEDGITTISIDAVSAHGTPIVGSYSYESTALKSVYKMNTGLQKLMQNGQMFIIKNGVMYNVLGNVVE